MATLTISLPEPLRDWVEERSRDRGYESPGDYVRELIHQDRDERELTLAELRDLVSEARASGISERTIDEIAADARVAAGLRD